MRHNFHGDVGRHIGDAGYLLGRRNQGVSQGGYLTLSRITQFNIKGDIAAVYQQIFQGFGGDKIFASIGVDDRLQGRMEIGQTLPGSEGQ